MKNTVILIENIFWQQMLAKIEAKMRAILGFEFALIMIFGKRLMNWVLVFGSIQREFDTFIEMEGMVCYGMVWVVLSTDSGMRAID